ncbi:MAG: translation initiation factor IF-2 [Acidobacteria bacterium]|nr:translation initiation factor IF-2 [Acidobacteriota bacterium]
MGTIRIYKIAEVLGIPSQEVVQLLRTQHGIEAKSASSTVEEIVARQFAERIARKRNVTLPAGSLFSQRTASKRGGRGGAAPEAAAPTAPKLGPPRLVKSAKAARAAAEATAAGTAEPEAAGPENVPAGTASPPAAAVESAGAPGAGVSAAAAASTEPTSPPLPAPPRTLPATPRLRVEGAPRLRVEAPRIRVEEPPAPAGEATEPTPAPLAEAARTETGAPPARAEATPQAAEGTPHVESAPPREKLEEPPRIRIEESPRIRVEETPRARVEETAHTRVEETPRTSVDPAPAPIEETPRARVEPPRIEVEGMPLQQTEETTRAAAEAKPLAAPKIAPPTPPAPAATSPPAPPRAAAPAQPTVPSPARRPGSGLALRPTGRVVPPRLRLRIEEPKPVKPRATPPVAPRPPVRPVTPQVATGVTGPAARPPLGGPRPLPSQPVRPPAAPRPLPPRPAVGYRPPPRPHHRPGGRRAQYRRTRTQTPATPAPPPPVTRTITLAEGMTVKDLAERLEVKPKDVLKKLIERRVMMTINTTLDSETATTIAREFGADVKMRTFEEEMVVIEAEETRPDDLIVRAPVVTVMGHVDHGKTTLLDAIRETKVAEGEAGGITQHIGAYAVEVNGRRIVFLDTPGHEAFTLMRARGAQVTDVVILVVAADDGVMPQTQEAIDHAQAAKVPIIVAINKIDKADANLDRVKKELAERGLTPEDWGGSTVTVPLSAKKRDNLDGLLEMILLVTELEEQKANPKRAATGTVLEAKVDRGRGPVATILVQDGTLRVGDNFIAGVVVGRVRALLDDRLQKTDEVGPSSPVEVLGLTGLPQPGDAFQAVTDAAKARQIAVLRQNQAKEKALGGRGQRLTLESLQQQLTEGEAKELPIIIKADVQGSAEVLADSLGKLGDERVKTRIIHTGVGAISEWDVLLASTSNAIVVGFNVRPDRNATGVAEREGVDIRLHSVIYDVTDELKKALAGLLDPTTKEVKLGSAEIRQTFKIPKFGTAAGCMVTEGIITRAGDAQARIVRDGVVVHEGRIGSLRRFKDDVNEVRGGMECGLAFERFADLKIGDVVESFTMEKVVATV